MIFRNFSKYGDIPKNNVFVVMSSLDDSESETFYFRSHDYRICGFIQSIKICVICVVEPEEPFFFQRVFTQPVTEGIHFPPLFTDKNKVDIFSF